MHQEMLTKSIRMSSLSQDKLATRSFLLFLSPFFYKEDQENNASLSKQNKKYRFFIYLFL
jgi:hypothetical protein